MDVGGLGVSLATVYSAALLGISTYLVNLGIDDVRERGRASILHWSFIDRCFSIPTLLHLFTLWLLCNAFVFAGNAGFRLWRRGRAALLKTAGSGADQPWNCCWMLATVVHHSAMVVLPAWEVQRVNLPASAACALCFEQVRLLMKSYAYLREHVRGALVMQDTNDSLGHLAYFLFAPTLVYQDAYERSARRRLGVAARHALLFLVVVFAMVVAAGRGALRPFCDGADASLLAAQPAAQLALHVVRATPAGAALAAGTALAMHSWHVVFAELLRFREQGFTQEWWNAPSYTAFFRCWNMFVKAWLYKYVFKELLARGHRPTVAKIMTITLSAFWHEYILAVSLGYVVPFCAFTYICTAVIVLPDPFKLQKGAGGNFFVLLTLSGGIASFLAFYFMESTARIHCAQTLELPWDIFVPRFLLCEQPLRNCTFI